MHFLQLHHRIKILVFALRTRAILSTGGFHSFSNLVGSWLRSSAAAALAGEHLLAKCLQFLEHIVPLLLRQVELVLNIIDLVVYVIIKLFVELVLDGLRQILVEEVVRVGHASSVVLLFNFDYFWALPALAEQVLRLELAWVRGGHQVHVLAVLRLVRVAHLGHVLVRLQRVHGPRAIRKALEMSYYVRHRRQIVRYARIELVRQPRHRHCIEISVIMWIHCALTWRKIVILDLTDVHVWVLINIVLVHLIYLADLLALNLAEG